MNRVINNKKFPRLSGLHINNHLAQFNMKTFKPMDISTKRQLRVRLNTAQAVKKTSNKKKPKETRRGANRLLPKTFIKGATRAGYKGP